MKTKLLQLSVFLLFQTFFPLFSEAQSLGDGLIGHYPCVEQDPQFRRLLDVSGFKHPGVLYGTPVTEPDNTRTDGYAVGVGIDAYATINEGHDLKKFDDLSTFTAAFFFMDVSDERIDCETACVPLMVVQGIDGHRYTLYFDEDESLHLTNESAGITLFDISSKKPTYLPPGLHWRHIAFNIDPENRTAELYLDGQLAASIKDQVIFAAQSPSVSFARDLTSGMVNNFRFCIDELRLYERQLKSSEVEDLANGVLTNTKNPLISVASISLFPNPAIGAEIQFQGVDPDRVVRVQLFDFSGRLLFREEKPGRNVLNLPAEASGKLLLQLVTTDGRIYALPFSRHRIGQ